MHDTRAVAFRLAGFVALAVSLLASACAHRTAFEAYEPGPEDDGFSTDEAFQIAGSTVPNEVLSFYFLLIDDSLEQGDDVEELHTLMQRAHDEEDYLGVAGPISARNLDVVSDALERSAPGALRGLLLIYLGPPEHIDTLADKARNAGARLHFLIYPAGARTRPPTAPGGDAAPL